MYEIFAELLDQSGKKTIDVARATGIPSSTFTDWKKGRSTPKQDKLKKIADFFNVSVDYLMTGKESVEETSNKGYYIDEETARTAQEIYNNDKILFDVYNTVDKERLVDFAKKLAELRKIEEGEEWLYYKGYYINVVILDESYGIPGCVRHNSDDSYTIFIDALLNHERQREVFLHEMRHILGDDFSESDVQMIEMKNHMHDYCIEVSTEIFPYVKNMRIIGAT